MDSPAMLCHLISFSQESIIPLLIMISLCRERQSTRAAGSGRLTCGGKEERLTGIEWKVMSTMYKVLCMKYYVYSHPFTCGVATIGNRQYEWQEFQPMMKRCGSSASAF